MYSNSCNVAYLPEWTFFFNVHVMKKLILRRVVYYCLSLSIEDEWCSKHEVLVCGYLLQRSEQQPTGPV
jgi:hypothetical protein